VLPTDIAYHTFVESKARRFASLYGYQELRTPTFEETGLFQRGAGESTDVVEKEMYSFRDKGDNDITLRAEGTAPVVRAYLQHGMHTLPQPVRLFSLISVFRYDRPQAGRLREHHQLDCEAIGEDDPLLDGELIALLWRFYEALGLRDLSLQINSIGDANCRPAYLELLRTYYRGHQAELCGDCRRRLEVNPLRLLDCKVPTCQPIAQKAPSLIDHLCDECAEHYQRVLAVVGEEKIPVVPNPRLVRGFDYYTRTVFEVWPQRTGEQSALGGGGRYDGLAEQLGGKHTPGVGFGTGIERLVLNLKEQGVEVPASPGPQVYVVHLGTGTEPAANSFARELRAHGVPTLRGVGTRSMRARLRHADAARVRWVVVFGEDEVKDGKVTLRDMAATEPETLSTEAALERIKRDEQMQTHLGSGTFSMESS
jgi:histidyl-tRNA synthetase